MLAPSRVKCSLLFYNHFIQVNASVSGSALKRGPMGSLLVA